MRRNIEKDITKNKLLIAAIILIAFGLRAPITAIGPIAEIIRDELNVTNGFIGFITTIPLLAFSACSPIIPKVSKTFGNGKTMFVGLLLISAGGFIRSYMGTIGIIVGTLLIGIGIATGNVLLPSIVKHRFPNNIGITSSIYLTSMGIFASISAGFSYPISENIGLGWRNTLAIWPEISLIALIIWIIQLKINSVPTSDINNKSNSYIKVNRRKVIWKSSLAWYITMYMGLQSIIFYTATAWLPSILIDQGVSQEMAGFSALGFQLIGIPATFFVPIFACRAKNQKAIVILICTSYFIGLFALLIQGYFYAIVLGVTFLSIAAAASFSWIMSIIGMRSKDAEEAAALSGMAQSAGYLLAAIGPTLCGMIFDLYGIWKYAIYFLMFVTVAVTFFGLLINKNEEL